MANVSDRMRAGLILMERRQYDRRCRVAREIYAALFSAERGVFFYFSVATVLLFMHSHGAAVMGDIDNADGMLGELEKLHAKILPRVIKLGISGIGAFVKKYEEDELSLPVWGFFVSEANVKQIFNTYGGLGDLLQPRHLRDVVDRCTVAPLGSSS